MTVRPSIFGSGSERDLYRAISSRWTDRFAVYPSIPFATLIELRGLNLANSEREFLLKTNVDYTICTKRDGRPLLSIEFDGLSHGFSRLGRYVQIHKCDDAAREWKLDLKVRVATAATFPFVVVSYHEKNPIGEGLQLSIVDGIIGQVLANRDFRYRLKNAEWYRLSSVFDEEIDAELRWNPISRALADIEHRFIESGLRVSHSTEWFNEPPLPDLPAGGPLSPGFAEALKQRGEAMQQAIWVGCRAIVQTPTVAVTKSVRMRNIEQAGVRPLGLTEELALLLAYQQVERGVA
jgi:hypothetical protein